MDKATETELEDEDKLEDSGIEGAIAPWGAIGPRFA